MKLIAMWIGVLSLFMASVTEQSVFIGICALFCLGLTLDVHKQGD